MGRKSKILVACAGVGVGLVALSGQPASNQAYADATVNTRSCDTRTFTTKVRDVNAAEGVAVTRLHAHTYPGRTVIRKKQRIAVDLKRNVSVSVDVSSDASVGAGGILKKVVKLYIDAHGQIDVKVTFSEDRHSSLIVVNRERTVIPAGKTVVWFKGYRTLAGSFKYSVCHHMSGMPEHVGIVEWKRGHFTTYGYYSDGGQRCDFKANEPVARAARQAVCG